MNPTTRVGTNITIRPHRVHLRQSLVLGVSSRVINNSSKDSDAPMTATCWIRRTRMRLADKWCWRITWSALIYSKFASVTGNLQLSLALINLRYYLGAIPSAPCHRPPWLAWVSQNIATTSMKSMLSGIATYLNVNSSRRTIPPCCSAEALTPLEFV